MKSIKPPQIIQENLIDPFKNNTVFLAGSIDMGEADNWQKEVEENLNFY